MPMSPRLLRPRAAAATGFDPRSISGLAFWYDAIDASTVTLNAGNVSEWRDKSGNGRHASQVTAASQPQYTSAGPFSSAVVCPSADRTMSIGGAVSLCRNAQGITLIAVHRPTVIPATQALLFFSRGDSATAARAVIGCGITTFGLEVGGRRLDANSYQQVNSTAAANTAYVHVGVMNYASASLSLFVNGTLTASSSSFQTAGNSEDTNSLAVSLFTNGSGGAFYQGAIAEVMAYTRAISSAEVSALSRYLGAKWGITVA